jgi:hypothetical protein
MLKNQQRNSKRRITQMKTFKSLMVATLFAAQLTPMRAENAATVVARCHSFQLQPFVRSDPVYGSVTAYFTTYAGQDLYPPVHDVSGANWIFSLEVRPIVGQPGVFATDYVSMSSTKGLFQYGHIFFTLPTTDSDGDGVPDFLKRERSVNLKFTGTQTAIYPSRVTVSLTGTLTRAPGQVLGQMSFNNGISHSGNWNLGNLSGTMTYIRSNGVPVEFAMTGVQPNGTTHSWRGGAIANPALNQIGFPALKWTRDDGTRYQVAAGFAAVRRGARYVGAFALVDGLAGTSWPDLTNWVLEVTDASDVNSNGIPDLTDAPTRASVTLKRAPSSYVLSITGQAGCVYSIQRSADLKSWNSFTNVFCNGSLSQVRDGDGRLGAFYRVRFP